MTASRAWLLTQIVGLAAVIVGVTVLLGWPWSLIVSGVVGVVVGEVKT